MQPQRHTSPDARLTLVSEPTTTIDATNPEGRDDWIIELTPGDTITYRLWSGKVIRTIRG